MTRLVIQSELPLSFSITYAMYGLESEGNVLPFLHEVKQRFRKAKGFSPEIPEPISGQSTSNSNPVFFSGVLTPCVSVRVTEGKKFLPKGANAIRL